MISGHVELLRTDVDSFHRHHEHKCFNDFFESEASCAFAFVVFL